MENLNLVRMLWLTGYAIPRRRSPITGNSGFTMIEILVVVILIGVLSAIAAPSWITFTNRQRVGAANEIVVQAIQKAQSEAKKNKRQYTVSFRTVTDPVSGKTVSQVAVHTCIDPTNGSKNCTVAATKVTSGEWQNVGEPGQILVGTNITIANNVGTATSLDYTTINNTPKPLIIFDYMGTIPSNSPPPDLGTKGLIIAVAISQGGSTTTALDGTKRCAKVRTLLGSIQAGKESECDP